MKKLSYLIILTVILGLVLTGCLLSNVGQVPTSEQSGITYLTKGAPIEIPLLAGQTNEVGTVYVSNNADYLYVKYLITDPDWCLTETHVHVGKGLTDFPLNRGGNPKIGLFDYKAEHECVTEYIYVIPLSDGPWGIDDQLWIAAHAVVSTQPVGERTILYGSQRSTSDNGLYQIDLEAGTATHLYNTGETGNSPNALGYDPANMRLYYMKFLEPNGPSVLYFYDLVGGMEYAAGLNLLGQVVVGASFYDGAYYYIPNSTADLHKVTLNAAGYVTNDILLWENFNGDEDPPIVYRFGDFAIDNYGMLYASTNSSGGSTAEFFELNVETGVYNLIADSSTPNAALLVQVSFGSDGTLYGHAAGTGEFFEIDLTDGTKSSIGSVASEANDPELFSDLASGELFVLMIETAWGDGDRFTPKGNWATYFEYMVESLED